jgi:hypothetical protein
MAAATKAKTEDQIRQAVARKARPKSQQLRLDEELAESFPASDPPSITQPGIKPGAPERPNRRVGSDATSA